MNSKITKKKTQKRFVFIFIGRNNNVKCKERLEKTLNQFSLIGGGGEIKNKIKILSLLLFFLSRFQNEIKCSTRGSIVVCLFVQQCDTFTKKSLFYVIVCSRSFSFPFLFLLSFFRFVDFIFFIFLFCFVQFLFHFMLNSRTHRVYCRKDVAFVFEHTS